MNIFVCISTLDGDLMGATSDGRVVLILMGVGTPVINSAGRVMGAGSDTGGVGGGGMVAEGTAGVGSAPLDSILN